jgi:hypothetical protein
MDGLAIGAVHDAALGKAEGARKGTPRRQRQFRRKQGAQDSLPLITMRGTMI